MIQLAETLPHQLRLIVAGNALGSQRALKCVRQVCDERLTGAVNLEVIDIYQQPELAAAYQVRAAPTLVRVFPLPVRRIAGALSDPMRVFRELDAQPAASQGGQPV